MKQALLIVLVILGLLSVVAAVWRPHQDLGTKIPLGWVSDSNPARIEQIKTFNFENPDLFLSPDNNGGAEKIILQCSTGVGPDIFDLNGDNIGMYVEAGVLMDLTDEAEKMGFSAKNDAWPSSEGEITYFGKQYSYPCNAGAGILIYNKNVFDYYGVPYPKGTLTWEEFVELSQKVNSISTGKSPGDTIYAISGATWVVFFDSMRGEFFAEDGSLHISDNENLRKAFEWHKDMLFKYRLAPTSYKLQSMSSQGGWGSWGLNQFAANRYAMVFTGNWSIIAFGRTYNQQIKNLKAAGLDPEKITDPMKRPIRLGCTMIPKFADLPACYRTTCRSAGINVKSPRRHEALKFLQYLAGPSYSRLVNENSDYLPGNPKYADVGDIKGPTELGAVEMHAATKEALKFGYSPRNSPFLLTNDVYRVLNDQINRMESDPELDVQTLLDTAQKQLELLLRRNLERNPDMKKSYEERFGSSSAKS